MRARDDCRSSRACALATASETSSQNVIRRASLSGGNRSAAAIATAPQGTPPTKIGAATVER